MQAREGELIETKDGIIFDVKGLTHPPDKVIAFPRFIPSTKGNRERKEVKYEYRCDNCQRVIAVNYKVIPDGWWEVVTSGPRSRRFFCSKTCVAAALKVWGVE